jgi:tRNA pseudouridine38-40 synthase
MRIKLSVTYDGTNYCGWQVQPNGITVQQVLEDALFNATGERTRITGSGRTDAGVHARSFKATVTRKGESSLETHILADKIPLAMNAHLPNDISVIDAEWVNDSFHPRYDVKYKEYIYRIYTGRVRDPFEDGRAWDVHYDVFDDNALNRMNEAASHFVGEYDFSAFMASGSKVESTVRNVKYASVEKNGNVITFKVAANGFLYNMVRIMTGTLVAVAIGKIAPDDILGIIESKDRSMAGMTAPACGLYLNKVVY